MGMPGHDAEGKWKEKLPKISTVADAELAGLEAVLSHKLPIDYIDFLKHKHFNELIINEASFCRHLEGSWQGSLKKMIFNGYPRKYLIDRGFIPFADWSDWGLLCFDTSRGFINADYPVVIWDHEKPDWNELFGHNFKMAIKRLDKKDNESRAGDGEE